jgi:hypothetical protein
VADGISELGAAALAYAQHGWLVLPLHEATRRRCSCGNPVCHSPGKHPRTANGLHDASSGLAAVRAWWQRWPRANIGLACEASGLAVVDVDPRNGGKESCAEIALRRGSEWSRTLTVLTGGGGQHFYFEAPRKDWPGKLAPGIDLKQRGYVVAPPSVHASGDRYRWAPGHDFLTTVVAPPPGWVWEEAMANSPSPSSSPPGARGSAPSLPQALPEGQRHSGLLSLAGTMRRRGMGLEAIRAALLAENDARCLPPLPHDEVQAIARSVMSYGPASAPSLARPQTVSGDELDALDIGEPRWVVQGLLPEGLSVLAGKPKSGKSWMALQVALAVARGRQALGWSESEQGEALYLALEDTRLRLQVRQRSLAAGERVPGIHFATEWPRVGEGCEHALEDWLRDHPRARLVVVDTLAKVRGELRGRGVYEDDYAQIGALKAIADRAGVAVLVVHHLRKLAGDDPVEAISGTMGIAGAADALLVLLPGLDGSSTLHVTGRDVEAKDLRLVWDKSATSWSVQGDVEEGTVSLERARVLRALRKSGKPQALADLAHEIGVREGALQRLLYRMAHDGEVYRAGRGVWAPRSPEAA